MYCLYKHIRNDNNHIFYIGIGKHVSRAYDLGQRNRYWRAIVKKYGYTVEIIASGLSREKAIELEIIFISFYGRKDLKMGQLVNLTNGGEGVSGFLISDEYRKRMSLAISGEKHGMYGKRHTDESKKKIGEASSLRMKGEKNIMYGKKHKPESMKSMIEKKKGYVYPKLECPYCGIKGGKGNLKRYHFNNCKNKINE